MKVPHAVFSALLASIPTAALMSCAQIQGAMNATGLGIGPKQTLETDVAELRSMRSNLEGSWEAIQGRVSTVEQDVANFGPGDQLRGTNVNLTAVSDDILNSTEILTTEAGASNVTTVDVEAAYHQTDAATRAEIAQVQTEGKRIMSELSSGIPVSLATLGSDAGKTVAKAATMQLKAENMGSIAAKNPLMTEENMATMRSNTTLIQQEFDKLSVLAEKIGNESAGISGRMTQALTTFQGKVTALQMGN